MRSIALASATLLAALAVLIVASTGRTKSAAKLQPTDSGAQQTDADGVRRITVEELRAALDKGTAVAVDVRSVEQYKAGHIKGALSVPTAEIAARAKDLPKDKLIVTYCS